MSNQKRFFILFLIAIAATAASFYTEYVLGYAPCLLCWVQRAIYLALIPLSLICLLTRWKNPSRITCLAVLAIGFSVSFYHSLVQLHLVKDRCKAEVKISDLQTFKNLINNKKSGCAENAWKIGPVPLSAVNGIILLALGIYLRKK